MKANFKEELLKAKAGKYAIPAFNFDNLEMAKGIIAAAEAENFPVILMVTESAAKYIGLEYVYAIGKIAVEQSQVPLIFHWDHGFDIELIKRACDNGFSSVMLDASTKSFKENVKLTNEIVDYAHARGVYVESEIGHVGGKEDDRDSKETSFTDVNEAIEFNKLTGIDALAIAAGTAHGVFKSKPKLQYDLIEEIVNKLSTPIVLHGSSGVPHEDLQKAISLGITKINIGTDLKIAYAEALKTWFVKNPQKFDARQFGSFAIEAVKKVAIEKIKVFKNQ
ncbi:class II fructose-bisphosphate aldolase [Mesoplasma seiffertii]|uniref:class II fructose-bisphosphate aldolase n=1 Tax=Mesoplasma seiffertii TaxID=28224 RepID=UPI000479FED0|nr:class II fructose-bisphosphate aldolase [Mesoplasma seiffertii]